MLVCGVLLATPNAIYSPGLPLALLAWSITEIIRYGFYGLNLLNIVPSILIFLRWVHGANIWPAKTVISFLYLSSQIHYLHCVVPNRSDWWIVVPVLGAKLCSFEQNMEHRNAESTQLHILVLLLLVDRDTHVHSDFPAIVLTHVCAAKKGARQIESGRCKKARRQSQVEMNDSSLARSDEIFVVIWDERVERSPNFINFVNGNFL